MMNTSSEHATAEDYPAKCTISDEELRELKAALTANEEWRSYTEEWPPTDAHGNVYDIWFTVDELNTRGELIDSNGNSFSPFTGNKEPLVNDNEPCNAPVGNWRERYPSIRYCGQITAAYEDDYTYCYFHRNREHVMKTAEEHIQTGFFVNSIDHLYEQLDPAQKLFGWGTFESLMGESSYEFGVEYREKTFDFSDAEGIVPAGVDEDGTLDVKCGYPTQHVDPALSLYCASMMGVQMISVQPKIMEVNREEGEDMMESRTIETAQLTAPPSEHDLSPQEFKTLETWSEHHLNLPFSRLVTDRPKLLERGGVTVDPEDNADSVSGDDIILDIHADVDDVETSDDTGTDPNAFGEDLTAESEHIVDAVEGVTDGG